MTKKLYKIIIFILATAFTGLLLNTGGILSQEFTEEKIDNFDVEMTIDSMGLATITERIDYNFGNLNRHGIYRDFKVVFTNNEGVQLKTPLKVISVTNENGKKHNYEQSTYNSDVRVKIGNPNRTVTGKVTYVITYTLEGFIEEFLEHDEIYYNVTGSNWEVPIDSASFTIIFPDNAPNVLDTICFTGAEGSTDSNCAVSSSEKTVTFSTTSRLEAYQGLSAAVKFEKGIIPILPKVEYHLIHPVIVVILVILGFIWYILTPLYIVYYYFKNGRDPKPTYESVPALFEAPKKGERYLTPAEIGTIYDEVVDNSDITATIVGLAIRGFIKIEEKTEESLKGKILKTKDFELTKLDKDTSQLLKFEKTLLTKLFGSKDSVILSEQKYKFATGASKIKDELYSQVVNDGYFPHNPLKIRNKWLIYSTLGFMTFNIHTVLLLLILSKHMPRKTKEGADIKVHAEGMKLFLTSQDKQLEFQEQNWFMFEKLLPYAIALGVTETWIARFKDLHETYQPNWYTGSSIAHMDYFANSINSFNSSVSAASATQSSSGSSSGFSGGSSGGGSSGGGGGGSW